MLPPAWALGIGTLVLDSTEYTLERGQASAFVLDVLSFGVLFWSQTHRTNSTVLRTYPSIWAASVSSRLCSFQAGAPGPAAGFQQKTYQARATTLEPVDGTSTVGSLLVTYSPGSEA